jgi:hypothetical protein
VTLLDFEEYMTPKQWLAAGALALTSFAVAAQQARERPNPLDANAAVQAASYKSAFDNYQRTNSDQQPSADKVWRRANEEVAKPHADTGRATQTAAASSLPEKAPSVDHGNHH